MKKKQKLPYREIANKKKRSLPIERFFTKSKRNSFIGECLMKK